MEKITLMDDAFLRLESRRQPLHIGILMLFEPPKDAGPHFAAELAEKLRQHAQTEKPFNQKMVQRKGLHYWEEDEDFDLDQHFAHLSLPEPGRIRELLAMVSRVHSGHLDRSYPLWRMYLIEGIEDGRIAVYMKVHHAMVDGVGGMKMLLNSMSTDREQSKHMPPPWAIGAKRFSSTKPLPVPTPASESISALRSLKKFSRAGITSTIHAVKPVFKELLTTVEDFRHHNPNVAIGGLAPRSLFNDKISASRRFAAQSYSTPRIKAIAQEFDATTNDVILAMIGGGLRRYLEDQNALPEQALLAGVPVSLKRRGSTSKGGNDVAFTITHLATNIADPVERLIAIKNCMDYNKERLNNLSPGQIAAYAALLMMPMTLTSALGLMPDKTLGNVVVSHVPGPKKDMYWQGAKLCGMYPVSLILDGSALNITVVSRHDFVDFGLIACRKVVPRVQRLLDYFEEALVGLEKAVEKKHKVEARKAKTKAAAKKPAARKAVKRKAVAKKKPATRKAASGKANVA